MPHSSDSGHRAARAIGEILLCSGVPTQLLLAAALLRVGIGGAQQGGLSLPFVAALSLADTVLLLGLMVGLSRSDGPPLRALWLGQRPAVPEILAGVFMSPFILLGVGIALFTVQRIAPWMHNVPDNPLQALARGGIGEAVALGVVAIVAGAIREELQRAFLLDRFERHLGPTWLGIVVLSIGFGLGHLVQGWDAVLVTGCMGALWATIYARRRSVLAPLVSHAIFNSIEIARMLIAPS